MTNLLHLLKFFNSLFLICFLFQSSLSFSSSIQTLSHDDECFALFQFKQSFVVNRSASYGPFAFPKAASWKLNASEGGTDCCLWDGVECTEEASGQVVGLDLSNSFLYGSINANSSLFNLLHLQRLNLSGNNFIRSEIPWAIGRLSQLRSLNLSYSYFSGQIPIEISQLTSLTSLHLSDSDYSLKLQNPSFKTLVENLTRLEELILEGVDINSQVPDALTNFSSLRVLYLDDCRLTGEFPEDIVHLPKLQTLILWYNPNLTGYLPEFRANSELEVLKFYWTKFSGSLPSSLNNLAQLVDLQLVYNDFTGPIPRLSNLSKLTRLDLRRNNIYGVIPSSIVNLTQLDTINLVSNQLKGPIPSSLSNLNKLTLLVLSLNNFSGTVESHVFLNMRELKVLTLGGNRISFVHTCNYTNATLPKLQILGLKSCNLKTFPDFLRFQYDLMYLDLSYNEIDGQIPVWLVNNSMEILAYKFSNNRLTGEIPPVICKLQNLALLELSSNNLTGPIPPCFGNMSSSLSVLKINDNNFWGTIPNTYTKGCTLRMIDLSQNQFEGKVPTSLLHCTLLQYLNLGNNNIQGTFPLWLGGLLELQVLILCSNVFQGAIQSSTTVESNFPKLKIVDLSDNGFEGDLPHHYFHSWKAMENNDVDVGYMEADFIVISKAFPQGTFSYAYSMHITNKGVKTEYDKIITIFKGIDLSNNQFSGKIPESIGSLIGIQMLNLSNNHLVGSIPLSIQNLAQLESLDISHNQLSGAIPQQLAQLTFLEVLNLSNNNLSGPIPQGNQFTVFENSSYEGNPSLCGAPLSVQCGSSHTSTPPPSIDSDSFPNRMDWVVICLGLGSGLVIGLVIGNHLTTR